MGCSFGRRSCRIQSATPHCVSAGRFGTLNCVSACCLSALDLPLTKISGSPAGALFWDLWAWSRQLYVVFVAFSVSRLPQSSRLWQSWSCSSPTPVSHTKQASLAMLHLQFACDLARNLALALLPVALVLALALGLRFGRTEVGAEVRAQIKK